MSGDGTYAPKSPDLSSFYSAGPTPPAEPPDPQQLLSQQSQPNFSHVQFAAASQFSAFHQQPNAPHTGTHHQDPTPPQARPTNNNITTTRRPSSAAGGNSLSPAHHEYIPPRVPGHGQAQQVGYTPPQQASSFYQQPSSSYGDSSFHQYQYQPHHQFPPQQISTTLTAAQAQVRQPYIYPGSIADEARQQGSHIEEYEPPLPLGHHQHHSNTTMPPRRAAAAAAAAQMAAAAASGGDSDPEQQQQQQQLAPAATGTTTIATQTSPNLANTTFVPAGTVRTKFPTARIKRIMQADEEVGKVAQQTPIAVGKALELFMVALVTKSAEVARQRNSKRVSAQMLKQVVEGDDQWDFLRDIVSKVEVGEEKGEGAKGEGKEKGAGPGRGRAGGVKVEKGESDTEEEGGEGAGAAPKRKRGGGGRKKKVKGE